MNSPEQMIPGAPVMPTQPMKPEEVEQGSGEVRVNRVLSYQLHRKLETPLQAEDALELVITTGDLSQPEDRAEFEAGLKEMAHTLETDVTLAQATSVHWYAPFGNTSLYEDKYGDGDEPTEKAYAATLGFQVGDFVAAEDGGIDRDDTLCGMSRSEFINHFGK